VGGIGTTVQLVAQGHLIRGVTLDASGHGQFTFVAPTGIVVSSGKVLCLDNNQGASDVLGKLHGFLAADR
jgi:hypothetical protein